MRFLIDENVSGLVVRKLQAASIIVVTLSAAERGAPDEIILELANIGDLVVITEATVSADSEGEAFVEFHDCEPPPSAAGEGHGLPAARHGALAWAEAGAAQSIRNHHDPQWSVHVAGIPVASAHGIRGDARVAQEQEVEAGRFVPVLRGMFAFGLPADSAAVSGCQL